MSASGTEGANETAFVRTASKISQDRDRPSAMPAHLRGVSLKECVRDRDGNWMDDIPDGNGRPIDAVRYAVMDDVLRG